MHVVLLGTGGGPRPSPFRHPSSQAIVLGERLLVVDCGNGVVQQMVAAGLDPRYITDILLTHHHIDHSADLAILPMTSWINGRTDGVRIAGPPPTSAVFASLVDAFGEDLRRRTASTGRPDFHSMVSVTDVEDTMIVHEDDEATITSARMHHPPFTHALAYRIDTPDGSVVISGDTTPCPELVQLARGADLLIHEVVHPRGIMEYQRGTNATTIADHLRDNHTMVDQVGEIAEAAGVGTLVLSHLVPHSGISDDEWVSAVGNSFTGQVIVGFDLQKIQVEKRSERHAGCQPIANRQEPLRARQ